MTIAAEELKDISINFINEELSNFYKCAEKVFPGSDDSKAITHNRVLFVSQLLCNFTLRIIDSISNDDKPDSFLINILEFTHNLTATALLYQNDVIEKKCNNNCEEIH